jgi:predicted LPLAT superfamily acyltransferase
VSTHWKQRPDAGSRRAIRLLIAIARHGGRRLARVFLYPITLYFLCLRGPERRGSMLYLTRALGRPARWADAARHLHTFSATVLDRVFLLGGRLDQFDVRVAGLEDLHRVLDQRRGVLLFGSHLGSFEVLRVLARRRPDYTIRVVLDKGQNPAMTQLLDELNPEVAAGVIDAAQDGPSIAIAIKQACDEGALVALLVDRARPGEPALPAPFFGHDAPFPTAPWLIASVLRVPVVLGFGLYRGGNRYDLAFEAFSDGIEIPRAQRAAALPALIRRYAARLEHVARGAPYNWFNFYDFWMRDDRDDPTAAIAGPAPRVVDDAAVQRGAALHRRAAGG